MDIKQTVPKLLNKWPVFGRSLAITACFYGIQIYFAIACLFGLALVAGVDSSIVLTGIDLLTFDTLSGAGGAVLILGMVGALLCGLLIFIVSAGIFTLSNLSPFRGLSILVLAACSTLLLIPILNLLPIMWLWNLYVTVSKD